MLWAILYSLPLSTSTLLIPPTHYAQSIYHENKRHEFKLPISLNFDGAPSPNLWPEPAWRKYTPGISVPLHGKISVEVVGGTIFQQQERDPMRPVLARNRLHDIKAWDQKIIFQKDRTSLVLQMRKPRSFGLKEAQLSGDYFWSPVKFLRLGRSMDSMLDLVQNRKDIPPDGYRLRTAGRMNDYISGETGYESRSQKNGSTTISWKRAWMGASVRPLGDNDNRTWNTNFFGHIYADQNNYSHNWGWTAGIGYEKLFLRGLPIPLFKNSSLLEKAWGTLFLGNSALGHFTMGMAVGGSAKMFKWLTLSPGVVYRWIPEEGKHSWDHTFGLKVTSRILLEKIKQKTGSQRND
ncbi:MAG: hypothetical protein HY400_02425 [Elusimicrobia bacterium]|nr:hypothetical protein [Elusimicrobiota bacterium]